MKFYFNREGQKEEVALEQWVWVVQYNDGSELHQFEINQENQDEGVFHQVGEIKQEEVKRFILSKSDQSKNICIVVPEGAKLVHKYVNVGMITGGKRYEAKTYVFGYKVGGQHFLNYILPNDLIIQSTDPALKLVENGFIKF